MTLGQTGVYVAQWTFIRDAELVLAGTYVGVLMVCFSLNFTCNGPDAVQFLAIICFYINLVLKGQHRRNLIKRCAYHSVHRGHASNHISGSWYL